MEREDLKELLKKAFIEGNSLYKNSNITVDDWLDLFLNQYELNHPYDYKSIGLEGGGSATFTGEPSKKDIEAVNALANAARKKFKLPESTATVSDWKERLTDDILGLLYKNKTDESDEGSWIESNDFYKVAEAIADIITPQAPKEVREVYLPVSVEEWKKENEDCGVLLTVPMISEHGKVRQVFMFEIEAFKNDYKILKKVSLSLPKGETGDLYELYIEADGLFKKLLPYKEFGEDERAERLYEIFTTLINMASPLPIKEIEGKL